MKIRNGFVSNSSSSSFICVGINLNKFSDDQKKEFLKEHDVDISNINDEDDDLNDLFSELCWDIRRETGFCILSGIDDGIEEDGMVFGKMIAEGDDIDNLPSESFSLNDLNNIGNEVKKEFNIDGEVKLFVGTRAC
jgi:hypothetical protein